MSKNEKKFQSFSSGTATASNTSLSSSSSLKSWLTYCFVRYRSPQLTIDPKTIPLLQHNEKQERIKACRDDLEKRLQRVCDHIQSKLLSSASTQPAVEHSNSMNHPAFNKRYLFVCAAQCLTIEVKECKSSESKVQCTATNQILSVKDCVTIKFTMKDKTVKENIIVCKAFGDALLLSFYWIRIPTRCELLAYDLTRWTPALSVEQMLSHPSVVTFVKEVDEYTHRMSLFAKAISNSPDTGIINIKEIDRFPFHIKTGKEEGLGQYRYEMEGGFELIRNDHPNKTNTLHLSERNVTTNKKKLYRIQWRQFLLFNADLTNGRLLISKKPLDEWVKLLPPPPPPPPSQKEEKTASSPGKEDYLSVDGVLQEIRQTSVSKDDIQNAQSVFVTPTPGLRFPEHFQRFYMTNGKPPSCCMETVIPSTIDSMLRWWKGHLQEMDIKEEYINEWCSEVKSAPSEPLWDDLMARRNSIVRCFLQLKVAGESAGAGSSGSKSKSFSDSCSETSGFVAAKLPSPPKHIQVSKDLYKEIHSHYYTNTRKRKKEESEDESEDLGTTTTDDENSRHSSSHGERKHVDWKKINVGHYLIPLCASKTESEIPILEAEIRKHMINKNFQIDPNAYAISLSRKKKDKPDSVVIEALKRIARDNETYDFDALERKAQERIDQRNGVLPRETDSNGDDVVQRARKRHKQNNIVKHIPDLTPEQHERMQKNEYQEVHYQLYGDEDNKLQCRPLFLFDSKHEEMPMLNSETLTNGRINVISIRKPVFFLRGKELEFPKGSTGSMLETELAKSQLVPEHYQSIRDTLERTQTTRLEWVFCKDVIANPVLPPIKEHFKKIELFPTDAAAAVPGAVMPPPTTACDYQSKEEETKWSPLINTMRYHMMLWRIRPEIIKFEMQKALIHILRKFSDVEIQKYCVGKMNQYVDLYCYVQPVFEKYSLIERGVRFSTECRWKSEETIQKLIEKITLKQQQGKTARPPPVPPANGVRTHATAAATKPSASPSPSPPPPPPQSPSSLNPDTIRDILSQAIYCTVCFGLAEIPVVTPCGCTPCLPHLEKWKKATPPGGTFRCPSCQQELPKEHYYTPLRSMTTAIASLLGKKHKSHTEFLAEEERLKQKKKVQAECTDVIQSLVNRRRRACDANQQTAYDYEALVDNTDKYKSEMIHAVDEWNRTHVNEKFTVAVKHGCIYATTTAEHTPLPDHPPCTVLKSEHSLM